MELNIGSVRTVGVRNFSNLIIILKFDCYKGFCAIKELTDSLIVQDIIAVLILHSTGTSWGMDGYIYMARNRNNNCGIANTINYPY